jgi:hypothetical protein
MSGPGSSAWLKKELKKLERDGKVKIFTDKETAAIAKRINAGIAQAKLEYRRIAGESERDAAKVFITC